MSLDARKSRPPVSSSSPSRACETDKPGCLLHAISSLFEAEMASKSQQTFAQRAANHPNPLAKRLFEIAELKHTNIVLSADLTTTADLLQIADGKCIVTMNAWSG